MSIKYQIESQPQVVLTGNGEITPSFPTIYVLLGGTGMKTGMALRRKTLEAYGMSSLPFQEYLWIDTDANEQKVANSGLDAEIVNRLEFNADEKIPNHVSLAEINNITALPHNYEWLTQWLDPHFLATLGVDASAEAGARQIRALGRLAFELRFEEFKNTFLRKLDRLKQPNLTTKCQQLGFEVSPDTVEIVLICSIAGGTGSGAFIQAAKAIRYLTKNSKVNLSAYLLMPSIYQEYLGGNAHTWRDVQANAYASLQELNSLSSNPNCFWIKNYRDELATGNPFSEIFLVERQNQENLVLNSPADKDAFNMIADTLFYDFENSDFGVKKRSHRNNVRPHLANHMLVNIPVDDDTIVTDPQQAASYIFRFPTTFGSFGVSRIPFDRQRLQRAAGSLLGAQLFEFLISNPAKSIVSADIRQTKLKEAQLNSDQVISSLITDPVQALRFYEILKADTSAKLSKIKNELASHLRAEGTSMSDHLSRLRAVGSYATEVKKRVDDILNAKVKETLQLLRVGPVNGLDTGAHYKHILEQQEIIFNKYKSDFRAFIANLLGDPLNYGFKYAYAVCELLNADLKGLVHQAKTASVPKDVEFDEIKVSLSSNVESIFELQAEADALWLPVYGSIARSYYKQQNKKLVEEEAESLISLVSKYISTAEEKLAQWAKSIYEYNANFHSSKLFEELANFVGNQTEVNQEFGQKTVETTGLLRELNDYEKAVKDSIKYFNVLYKSYAHAEQSSRNSKELLGEDQILGELTKLLNAKTGLNKTKYDIFPKEWQDFATDNSSYLAVGNKDTYQLLTSKLIELAKMRVTDSSKWNNLQIDMEIWTVERLKNNKYLADESSLKILGNLPYADQIRQMNYISKSAQPWIKFDTALKQDINTQENHLLGVETTNSQLIREWKNTNAASWQEIINKSGSITLYRESMAFPIFAIASLVDLEQAYQQIKSESEILKRHTMHDYLSLSPLRPPLNIADASVQFKMERLAFESILLGLFTPKGNNKISYDIIYENGAKEQCYLSSSFIALSHKIQRYEPLRRSLKKDLDRLYLEMASNENLISRCLELIVYTFNVAFPLDNKSSTKYLENQLALSISRQWLNIFSKNFGRNHANPNETYMTISHSLDSLMNRSDFIDSQVTSMRLASGKKLLCIKAKSYMTNLNPTSYSTSTAQGYTQNQGGYQSQNAVHTNAYGQNHLPISHAQGFQGNPQGQFPGNPQGQFPGNPQGQFPGNPQGQFPGNPQGQFPGNPQGQFPGNPQGQFQGNPQAQFSGNPQGQFPGNPQMPFQSSPMITTPDLSTAAITNQQPIIGGVLPLVSQQTPSAVPSLNTTNNSGKVW